MEFKDKTPKKNLAEQSFRLALSDFGRGLLLPKEKIENENLYFLSREAGELKGKSGRLELSDSYSKMYLIFNVDLNRAPKRLILYHASVSDGNSKVITQKIELNESVVGLGVRPFFSCECGRQASVIYRPRGQNKFKCRVCSNITYESCNINKQSLNGLLYFVHKLGKLTDKREKIQRMYHAGKLTKKALALTNELEVLQKEVEQNKEAMINTHKMLVNHRF